MERTWRRPGETATTSADKESSVAHETKQDPEDLCQSRG